MFFVFLCISLITTKVRQFSSIYNLFVFFFLNCSFLNWFTQVSSLSINIDLWSMFSQFSFLFSYLDIKKYFIFVMFHYNLCFCGFVILKFRESFFQQFQIHFKFFLVSMFMILFYFNSLLIINIFNTWILIK